MARIEDSAGPAPARAVERLERRRIAGKLPAPYRRFLLTHNGGKPVPAGFTLPGPRRPYRDGEVRAFLGIDVENYDLETWCDIYRGRMPDELMPIALDPLGNVICLAIRGKQRGAVFFWDHERETHPADWSNVERVAGSFKEFLDLLE